MTETEVAVVPAAAASPAKTTTPKKAKAPKAKGERKLAKPATHPPVAEMVLAAITTQKERNGSSLQAIKKYIGANYKCNVAKLSIFIRKALVKGVEKGAFTQRKGTGASGSFKLAVKEAAPKKAAKKPAAAAKKAKTGEKKTAAAKKLTKKVTAKKPAGGKAKAAAAKTAKKAGAAKKAKAATPKKQKATKPSKTAAKKPKTPKPKKATPSKKDARIRSSSISQYKQSFSGLPIQSWKSCV